MTETDPHGLTAPYAVDAVTELERREAEEHLLACAACRAELADLAAALDELGAVAPVAPPPSLRAAVMARLDDVAQLPALTPAVGVARTPVTAPGTAAPIDPSEETDPAPVPVRGGEHVAAHRREPGAPDDLATRRAARRRRVLPLLSAAAAAVVLAGAAVLGTAAVHHREEQQAAQQAAVALGQVAAAPDAVTVPASTTTDPTWSQTRLVVSRQRHAAVLIPAGTRPAPAGRTWQLWFVSTDGARSAGTFRAGGSAGAEVLVGDPGPASAVAVSLEPAGGSTAPTTTPVATYRVPSA